jgi:hypothetical protein
LEPSYKLMTNWIQRTTIHQVPSTVFTFNTQTVTMGKHKILNLPMNWVITRKTSPSYQSLKLVKIKLPIWQERRRCFEDSRSPARQTLSCMTCCGLQEWTTHLNNQDFNEMHPDEITGIVPEII